MRKRIRLLSVITLLSLLLMSCAVTPKQLGISQSTWKSYTPLKKQKLEEKYKMIRAIDKRAQFKNFTADPIEVRIQHGLIWFPPFQRARAFQPIQMIVRANECEQVPVYATAGTASSRQKTVLSVCYLGDVLYLDGSYINQQDAVGSLSISPIPLWQLGFCYHHLSSTGYIRLTDVDVCVKRV